MSATFEIQLDRLPSGRSDLPLRGTLPLGEGSDPECVVAGELAVESMDQKVLVHGSFRVDRELACDRCAEPSQQHYDAELEVLVLRSPVRGSRGAAEEDAWVIHQQGGPVALDPAVREAVFLHEPQRVLCREDCQGLCPVCGINRNQASCDCSTEEMDPRWAALKELRDRTPDGSAE